MESTIAASSASSERRRVDEMTRSSSSSLSDRRPSTWRMLDRRGRSVESDVSAGSRTTTSGSSGSLAGTSFSLASAIAKQSLMLTSSS